MALNRFAKDVRADTAVIGLIQAAFWNASCLFFLHELAGHNELCGNLGVFGVLAIFLVVPCVATMFLVVMPLLLSSLITFFSAVVVRNLFKYTIDNAGSLGVVLNLAIAYCILSMFNLILGMLLFPASFSGDRVVLAFVLTVSFAFLNALITCRTLRPR